MAENYLETALQKLESGAKAAKAAGNRYARVVAGPVAEALRDFCRQDAEFAQAVAQGGTFDDCIAAVVKGVGGSLSDIEAYRRAAGFYFPGCVVEMQMVIRVNPHEGEPEPSAEATTKTDSIVLNFSDFF